MYLSAAGLLPWLAQKGLVKPAALVARPWAVVQPDPRRPLLRAAPAGGPGFFVKQAFPRDVAHVAMLDREAAIHHLVRCVAWARPLAPLLPRLYLHDDRMHMLVVEALPHDTALDHLRRVDVAPDRLGHLIGRSLARIHRPVPGRGTTGLLLPARLPWILAPESEARDDLDDAAVRMLLDLVRAELGLMNALAALRAEWRHEVLIHGDAKLDNVLARTAGRPRAWFVDWAFAGVGDAAWDVGTLVHSSLVVWLHGVRFDTISDDVTDAIRDATLPLDAVRAFIGALFAGYEATRAAPAATRRPLARRAFRYAGAAMVQTAIAAGRAQADITPRQLALVQMGMRLLDDPDTALATFHPAHAP